MILKIKKNNRKKNPFKAKKAERVYEIEYIFYPPITDLEITIFCISDVPS